jgi:hypothetical protein
MAPVSDTRYKQRAVIEFLVGEKESVGNIHKRLCAVYGSFAVDRSTVGRWFREFRLQEMEKLSCMIVRGLGILPQPPARHVAGRRWHYSWGSVYHKSENGSTAFSHHRKCNWFSTTMPVLTQVSEPKRQSPNLVGLCSPIPPIVLIWRRQIFIFWGHWRVHCVGQVLKMTRT